MTKLIVALGNPGREYELTKHNIGWLVIDQLSFYDQLIWKDKFKGRFATKQIGNEKYYILKPNTFMNLSGRSAQALMNFFKIELDDIIVIHDEMDLPFGMMAFKNGGGLAGHNGLKSIAECCGGKEFKRIRLGVGRPNQRQTKDWVLSPFGEDESIHLEIYLKKAAEAVEQYMKVGFGKAAGNFSRKSLIPNIND